jgi:CheY-like chemotaxis protein
MGTRSKSRSSETSTGRNESALKKPKEMNSEITAMRALIIEDTASDIQKASSVLNQLGVSQIKVFSRIPMAMEHLRGVVEGRAELPELLVLDLDFSMESGFEILRYWKASPKLHDMRVIVWTIMGELEQKVSRLFGVENVVDKHAGLGELEKALRWALTIREAS